MNKIVEENFEIFKTGINRILDDLYDMRDALNQSGITAETNEKLKSLESVAQDYEDLRRKLLNKEDLSDFELQQFKLIFAKIVREWDMQTDRIKKARTELKNLCSKF